MFSIVSCYAAVFGGANFLASMLQAKQQVVRATMSITVRNEKPSYRTGNYIQYFYLPYLTIPVPAEAAQLVAVSNGARLSVTQKPTKDPSTALATIKFPSNLLYGQSRTIDVSFLLKGEKPRSKNLTRVGPGYATFAVFGPGDAGQNSVKVVLPESMTFDATTDEFDEGKGTKKVTYTATGTNDAAGFWAVISARDPDAASSTTVKLGDQDVEVMAYPDDKRWLDFVSSHMTSGVPVLEELIGTPWPGGLSTVREDRSVNVRGYDGWFDNLQDSIVIGEGLDQEVLFHELSHAWASPRAIEERWIYEGLASDLAALALDEQGGKSQRWKQVTTTSKGAIPLNAWAGATGRTEANDDYAYPASYLAMKELLDGMDAETRAAVLSAAVEGRSAYAAPEEQRLDANRIGWQRFLDLVEVVGHNDSAPQTFKKWALTPEQAGVLDDRESTLRAYQEVADSVAPWVPPLEVRTAMTNWEYFVARDALTQIDDLGPAVKKVQEAGARHHLEIPDAVVAIYQTAEGDTELANLGDRLAEAATAVDAVGTADEAASSNPLATLGGKVLGVDAKVARADDLLADGDLDGATKAAKSASAAADRSTLVGGGILLGGLVLLGIILLLVRKMLGGRAKRRPATIETAPVETAPVETPPTDG